MAAWLGLPPASAAGNGASFWGASKTHPRSEPMLSTSQMGNCKETQAALSNLLTARSRASWPCLATIVTRRSTRCAVGIKEQRSVQLAHDHGPPPLPPPAGCRLQTFEGRPICFTPYMPKPLPQLEVHLNLQNFHRTKCVAGQQRRHVHAARVKRGAAQQLRRSSGKLLVPKDLGTCAVQPRAATCIPEVSA